MLWVRFFCAVTQSPSFQNRRNTLLLTFCASFGAVLEEFEVRDAMEGVFAEKSMAPLEYSFAAQQVSVNGSH